MPRASTPARRSATTHLRSADFFDVETFPELRFRSTRIEKLATIATASSATSPSATSRARCRSTSSTAAARKDPWGNERVGFVAKATSSTARTSACGWNQVLEAGGVLVGDRVDIELEVQGVSAAAKQAA